MSNEFRILDVNTHCVHNTFETKHKGSQDEFLERGSLMDLNSDSLDVIMTRNTFDTRSEGSRDTLFERDHVC